MAKDAFIGTSSDLSEEQYLSSESPEVSVGESRYFAKILDALPALQSRNYQLYFLGQLISQIGTWLQVVAEGWLVFQLTHSALLVGVDAAAASIPIFLLSLPSGVIVDRFPKKKIIILTQSSAMVLAFILGILAITKLITVWEIIFLGSLLGIVAAVDSPARQAFIVEMVGKKHLASAIALNSGVFNSARVIGPAIAGILIALFGAGGAFILNGASYIAVIIALFAMRVTPIINPHNLHPFLAIKEGINYSFKHPIIKVLMVFLAVISIFGWSYSTILPVIAQNTFRLGADGLGYLYTAIGLGAILGVLLVSTQASKIPPIIFILGGNMLFTLSLFLFSYTTIFPLALIFLFFVGFGIISQFSMMNTVIQNMVPDQIRGRVMSIYTFMFAGISPLGSFQIGWLSDHLGTGPAIRIGALIVLTFAILIYATREKIDAAYTQFCQANPFLPHERFF